MTARCPHGSRWFHCPSLIALPPDEAFVILSVTDPTSARLAAIRAIHTPGKSWRHECGACWDNAPCDTAEVLAELARVEAERDGRRAVLDAYKAHHAHFHADCNIDGPAPMPPKPEVDR